MEKQNSTDAKQAQNQFVNYLSNLQRWNRYPYVLNNPLLYTDPKGEDVTIYYREAVPFDALDWGHVFIYVRNDETGEEAYFDYYPDGSYTVLNVPTQSRLDRHASITIETSSGQEQAILEGIKEFAKQPDDFSFYTGSVCTTHCGRFLNLAGINIQALTPAGMWEKAFNLYATEDSKKDIKVEFPGVSVGRPVPPRIIIPAEPGKEYGRDPRGQARRVHKTGQTLQYYKDGKKTVPGQ